MAKFILKKLTANLCISIVLCIVLAQFSIGGRTYGGFLSAFLGAVYMLIGWFDFLKLMGTDFGKAFSRKKAPQVPYFHQKNKTSKSNLGMFFGKRRYDDSLNDDALDRESNISPQLRLRWRGTALMLCGAILLIISLFI